MFFTILLVAYQTGYWLKFAAIGALFSNSPLNVISGAAVITALSLASLLAVFWGWDYVSDVNSRDLQVGVGRGAEVCGSFAFFFGKIGWFVGVTLIFCTLLGVKLGLVIGLLCWALFTGFFKKSITSNNRFMAVLAGLLLVTAFGVGRTVAGTVQDRKSLFVFFVGEPLGLMPPDVSVLCVGQDPEPFEATYLGRLGDGEYFYRESGCVSRYTAAEIRRIDALAPTVMSPSACPCACAPRSLSRQH